RPPRRGGRRTRSRTGPRCRGRRADGVARAACARGAPRRAHRGRDPAGGCAAACRRPAGRQRHGDRARPGAGAGMRRRRLSFARLGVLILVTGALGAGGAALYARASAATPTALPGWYAPYVDATNTPEVQFQDPAQNPSNAVVLGFVVASASGTCTPTWGTYYSLA